MLILLTLENSFCSQSEWDNVQLKIIVICFILIDRRGEISIFLVYPFYQSKDNNNCYIVHMYDLNYISCHLR